MGKRRPRQEVIKRRNQLIEAISQKAIKISQQFQQLQTRRQVQDYLLHDNNSEQDLHYDRTHNYYQEFWNVFLMNEVMARQAKKLVDDIQQLDRGVRKIESLQEEQSQLIKQKTKKKHRRLAVEIGKLFECPYEKCFKAYGSDVSLNLHIKIKHNGGNKTERHEQARRIIFAQNKGLPVTTSRISFPPGYLEECLSKWNQF